MWSCGGVLAHVDMKISSINSQHYNESLFKKKQDWERTLFHAWIRCSGNVTQKGMATPVLGVCGEAFEYMLISVVS